MSFTVYPDDDNQFSPSSSHDGPPPMTAKQALVRAALALIDTRKVSQALLGPVPQLVLIETPTAQWARALAQLVDKSYEHTTGHAFTELKKDGNQAAMSELLLRLNRGRHVVICSPAPDQFVPKIALGAADMRLVLHRADPALLRRRSNSLPESARAPSGPPTSPGSTSTRWPWRCATAVRPPIASAGCAGQLTPRRCRTWLPDPGSMIWR